jgi:hypothetical protein
LDPSVDWPSVADSLLRRAADELVGMLASRLGPERRGGELAHAGFEFLDGVEAESVGGCRDGREDVADVGGAPVAGDDRLALGRDRAGDLARHLEDRARRAAADVEGAGDGLGRGEGDHVRARDVADVHEVARSCPPSSNTRGTPPAASADRKMLATPA